MRSAMSNQSAFIGLAVILGFYLGGMLFEAFGVRGIAVVGMIVLGLEMLSLIFFLVSPPNDVKHDAKGGEANEAEEDTNGDDEISPATLERMSKQNTLDSGRSTIRKIAESLQSGIVRTTVLG